MMGAADMRAWREGCDAAGIRDDDAPPDGLANIIRNADLVLASDLSRAIQTAERLRPAQPIRISALLREAPTPIPNWGAWKMPRQLWEWMLIARWGYRVVRRREEEPDDLARAEVG